MRQHVLIGAVLVVGVEAQAAPRPLGDDELKTAVVGKTVKIDTPLGTPITVMYSANGLMNGQAGTALGVYLGATTDRGRWSIKDGKLCQKWFKWLDAETTCMSIRQDGQKIFWKSDTGKTGTATIEPGPPVLAGSSASGLGLPQPPAEVVQAEPKSETPPIAAQRSTVPHIPTPPAVTPQLAEPHVQAAVVRPAAIARPAAPKAVAVLPRPELRRAAMLPMTGAHSFAQPALSSEAAQVPSERLSAEVLEPVPVRFAFASAAPVATLVSARTLDVEAFATIGSLARGDAEPWGLGMRQASQEAAHATLEHRWCLGNAFSTLPSSSASASGRAIDAKFADAAPSLLAVSLEQLYERELPLYDASCLTEQPAIRLTADGNLHSD